MSGASVDTRHIQEVGEAEKYIYHREETTKVVMDLLLTKFVTMIILGIASFLIGLSTIQLRQVGGYLGHLQFEQIYFHFTYLE